MGVRAVNLTWNFENAVSGTNAEGADKGLTEHGRAFVRRMTELGMLVDVSHLSDPGFWDVAQLVEGPFIAGHSNARALCPHSRNLTDEQFREICAHGGIAGLNVYAVLLQQFYGFLGSSFFSVSQLCVSPDISAECLDLVCMGIDDAEDLLFNMVHLILLDGC